MKTISTVILLISLCIGSHWAFSQAPSTKTKEGIEVEYATLMNIARKYGVDKNFQFTPSVQNKTGRLPEKVTLKMSLPEFEEWMKRVSFEEKQTQIIQQFYLKDYQQLRSVKEYIALKRAYVKRYPAYLKEVPAFQEEEIQREERNSENITLNTPYFQRSTKK